MAPPRMGAADALGRASRTYRSTTRYTGWALPAAAGVPALVWPSQWSNPWAALGTAPLAEGGEVAYGMADDADAMGDAMGTDTIDSLVSFAEAADGAAEANDAALQTGEVESMHVEDMTDVDELAAGAVGAEMAAEIESDDASGGLSSPTSFG